MTDLEKQNQAFLNYAKTGKARPKYNWLHALNVPEKLTPEQRHEREIDRLISEHARQLAYATTVQLATIINEANEVLKIGTDNGQDVTRLPAYITLAAACEILRRNDNDA